MRKIVLLSVLFSIISLGTWAQDDMYFTPKKKAASTQSKVDALEYDENSDIIDFEIGDGLYPDTVSVLDFNVGDTLAIYIGGGDDEDFKFTKRMGRFDDFHGYYDPYYFDYYHSPYFYSNYYGWYDPWAYRWIDPWYHTWNPGFWGYYTYYGWPYTFNYYDWGWPYGYGYYGGGHYYDRFNYGNGGWAHRGHTGTANHWGNGRTNRDLGDHAGTTGRSGRFTGARGGIVPQGATSGISSRGRSTTNNRRTGGTMTKTRGTSSASTNRNVRNFDQVTSNARRYESYDYNTNGSSSSRSSGYTPRTSGSTNNGGSSGIGHTGGTRSGGGVRSGGGGGHFGGRR